MKRGARAPNGDAPGDPEVHPPAVTAEDLETALHALGLKRSAARTAVLETFAAAAEHLSAEELTALVRRRLPSVSPSTVYRTLNILVRAGLAVERAFGDGHTRFEPARPEHHGHLICTSCGRVVEFRDDEIERLETAVAGIYGFEITTHKHELYGTCGGCYSARNAGKAT
jgi:Fur family transcriptional regulator, ferric uptake regulator